jgi:Fe-S-cluster containining protein
MATWLEVLQPTDDARPPPPPSGVPAQRLPAPARRALQLLVLPFVLLDVAAQRLVQRVLRPRWRLSGGCARSGHCCRYITQHASSGGLLVGRGADRLLRWWATEVNAFYARDFDVGDGAEPGVTVYSCRNLTAEGTCADYAFRPALCRSWPRVGFFAKPHLHKGCGYSTELTRG